MTNSFTFLMFVLCFLIGNCQNNGESARNSLAETADGEQIIKICIPNAPDYYTQQTPRIQKIEFLTSGNIWLATGGLSKEIYHFENAGQVWEKLQIGTVENFQTFDFPDAQNGWAVETNGNVWKTIDGGENWNPMLKIELSCK